MLPTFYQTLLQKYLSRSQLITLKMLVWLLQHQKQVRIERLAAALPLPIQLKQSAAAFAKVFKSGCFECSVAVVSPD
jgi:hypothetical protein